MVTVTGGKLTTYRRMSADTVDQVMRMLGRRGHSETRHTPLLGAVAWDQTGCGEHLAGRYGSLAMEIAAVVEADGTLGEPLVPGLPYSRAEAVYAAREAMACTLD